MPANPLPPNGWSSTGTRPAPPVDTSMARLTMDNLIRRELKVSDPNDARQVAEALMQRYRDDPRAQAITQEARGLPFLQTIPAAPTPTAKQTSSDVELQQARD